MRSQANTCFVQPLRIPQHNAPFCEAFAFPSFDGLAVPAWTLSLGILRLHNAAVRSKASVFAALAGNALRLAQLSSLLPQTKPFRNVRPWIDHTFDQSKQARGNFTHCFGSNTPSMQDRCLWLTSLGIIPILFMVCFRQACRRVIQSPEYRKIDFLQIRCAEDKLVCDAEIVYVCCV